MTTFESSSFENENENENFNCFKDALSNSFNYSWFDVGSSLSKLFW